MENFQRIICIWICCTSCIFGHTQLTSNAVTAEAVPYEYFDDRDEYLYDLDSEQIQAKYDAHLLAQQIVKTEQQQEQQQHNNQHNSRQHKNDFEDSTTHHHHYQHHQHHQQQHQHHHHHHGDNQNVHDDDENGNENENDDIGIIVKDNIDAAHLSKDLPKTAAIKKSNNRNNNFKGRTDNGQYDTGMDTNFNDNDDGDDDGNDIVGNDTDVDVDLEPHERAASCYTGGQHYTHGQKVPRLDNCEVCLCMDGEIFCWWEKCDKRMNKSLNRINDNIDYSSTPYATTNKKLLQQQPQHENKETSTKKPQLRERRIYDNDVNSDDDDNDNNENNSKEFFNLHERQYHRNQKKLKKKQSRRQQLKQMNWKQKMQQQQQQQQYNTPLSEHVHLQYHVSGGGGGANGVNSKILNFPENLPAILHCDYKTEEHQHHQHLHHQQHLKRQQQKLRNKVQHLKHLNRYPSSALSSSSASLLSHHMQQQRPQYTPTATSIQTMNSDAEPKMTAYYAGDTNQRFSSQDETQAQNDGDIMPEPQPIKNKLPNVMKALATQSTAIGLRVGGQSQSNLRDFNGIEHVKTNHVDNSLLKRNRKVFHHRSSQNINDMMTLDDKEIEENQKESVSNDNNNDDNDDDDYDRENEREDEAFHLWLTATEKNYSKTSDSGSSINTNGWKGNIIDLDIINATSTTTQIPLNEILRTTTTTITLATPLTGLQSDSTFSALNINQNNNINSNNNNNNNGILYNPYNMALDFSQQQNSADEAPTNSIVNIDITLTASPLLSEQREDMEESFSLKQTAFLPNEAPVTNTSFHLFSQESRVITNITATTTETTTISDNANSGGGNTNTNANNNNNFNPLQWRAFHLPLHQSETEAAAILTKEQRNDMEDMEDKSYNFTPDARVSEYGTGGSRDDNNRTLLLIGLPERVNIPPPSYITTATATATAKTSTTIAPASATTLNPDRQCNVMGTFYKIGDILPQDTGNCLQCICIDGSTIDDTPRVTCSPHNCPPLVLPDLFDATGY